MGLEWVRFHDDDGRLRSVPSDWTDLSAPDPFVALSDGRAPFKPNDLSALLDVVGEVTRRRQRPATPKRPGGHDAM